MNEEIFSSVENQPGSSNSKKHVRLFIAIGIAASILVIICIGFLVVNLVSTSSTDQHTSKQFQNWLKPTTPITVGSHRAVSPCQALPTRAVESIFGTLSDQTAIQETYLDQSVTADANEQQLSCRYNPVVATSSLTVGLETVQYPNTDDIKEDLGSSLNIFDEDKIQAEIDLYKKVTAASKDQDIKNFVSKLERSFTTYKKYDEADDPGSINVDSLVIPVSDTLSGSMGDFAFTGVAGNTVYTIYHTPKNFKGKNGIKGYSSQELMDELVAMKKATEAIAKNLHNSSLDQSPAPTIMAGDTDTYGSTKILEPCAIMTPALFTQITGGKQENHPVERTTVSKVFTTKYLTAQDKTLVLPLNQCDRQAEDTSTDTNTYGWFELQYGSSTKQAEEWLASNFKVSKGDALLQTDADWALAYADPGRPGAFLYIFRTGPYIGSVTLYSSDSSSSEVDAPREQYVQAINTLTAAIKEAAQKAK